MLLFLSQRIQDIQRRIVRQERLRLSSGDDTKGEIIVSLQPRAYERAISVVAYLALKNAFRQVVEFVKSSLFERFSALVEL